MTEDTPSLAILTSGGDAPGMNMALWAAAAEANRHGYDMIGFRRGYAGLLADDGAVLDVHTALGYARHGGTFLGTARVEDLPNRLHEAQARLESRHVTGLIVLGGDGSLAGAAALAALGVTTVGIPATIDDDVAACDETLGFDTAQATGVTLADGMRDSAEALPRLFSLETLGGDTGMLAQAIGEAVCADVILRPEAPQTLDAIVAALQPSVDAGKAALIVASEGYPDLPGVLQAVEERTGLRVRDSRIGHAQRGGRPSPRDRRLARTLAEEAVRRCIQGEACLLNPKSPTTIEARPWRALKDAR